MPPILKKYKHTVKTLVSLDGEVWVNMDVLLEAAEELEGTNGFTNAVAIYAEGIGEFLEAKGVAGHNIRGGYYATHEYHEKLAQLRVELEAAEGQVP